MSTNLNQHKIIPPNSVQNTRAKSNKTDNNNNKTPIINNNQQYAHSNNPPKISLRNQVNKKQQSKKDLQSNKQLQKDHTKGKSSSVLSQKQKDFQIHSNYSLNKKQLNQSQGLSEDNNLTRKQTKQFNNEKYSTDINKNNANKIHFYPHGNLMNESVDNKNQQRDKTNKIQYHTKQGNYPIIPNNFPPQKYFNPYTHNHVNSSSNINQYHKIQYPHKETKSGKVISTKQDSIQNSINNNYQPLYHTDKQYLYQFQNPNNTQSSNKKSLNSMSVTREELNCSQSVKNSNSSSFYDNHTSFNIITPLNSYNSLQHYNDSYQPSPTHYQFKNNPKTQFFISTQTNQNLNTYENLQNQSKNFHHFQNNLSVPQNSNYFKNFTRHQQHNNDQNSSYKHSFPVNPSSSSKTIFQVNSKSNLTIRNLEYGRNIQPVQRTKSHTKHYSNADFGDYHKISPSIQNSQNLNRINYSSQNQPYYAGKQNINNFQTNQQHSYFNQTHQGSLKSNNPYIINLISNINKSTEKALNLDSIAEKDEFGKVFVRGNQKIYEKSQSAQSNKYIQRQQDSSTKGTKHKINIISDSSKPQNQGPIQYIQVNQGPNFTNVKYIKNQTNIQSNNKPQYLQVESQKIKNCDKYFKINYQPILKNQRVSEHFFKQNEKHQTYSINSSFKENKSQTRSLHGNTKSKNQSIHDFNQYEKQRNLRNKSKQKRENDIQFSSFKNNLYQVNTMPNQKAFNFDKFTPKNKINSQHDPMSYSHGVYQNSNQNQYQSNFYPNHNQFTGNDQIRLNSPDSKQFVRSGNQNPKMYTSQQDYTGQKLTLFSPKQRDLRPAQKNHFIQQEQSQKYRESIRQKKSIKKMLISQSKGLHNRPQVLVSLNFKDLLKGQIQQGRPNSRTLLQVITKNHLTKVFCSTFKIGENQNGCDCIPKCYWVDQWLDIINNDIKLKEKSLMKNIDRNKLFNFSSQNLWKNKSKNQKDAINYQVTSFTDINNLSNLSTDEIETFKQIEKDIPRTYSSHPTFKNQKFKDFLREVLIHSYYLDPELGYVQGMNIITASIIYHSKTTQQALQLVDFIMNVLDFKKIYMNDMRKCRQLAAKTCQIIRINCYDMYSHVVIDNQVDLEMFIVGWYFSMLGTFVPLEAMHFVINKFIQKQFGGIMKIIVTFFIFIKDILMQKNDPNQIMQELSVQSMIDRSTKIDWNELISVSDKLKLTFDKQDL